MPCCSSGRAGPARRASPGSWPRPSTAPTCRTATRATAARPAPPSARARPSTSSRSTPRRIAASTRSASCATDWPIRPGHLRRKVYILDEAHQITSDAWNALLKSLEEPPDFVVFMFASTEPSGFPPAILSRLQRYDVRRLTRPRDRGQAATDPRGRRSLGRGRRRDPGRPAGRRRACATPSRSSTSSCRHRTRTITRGRRARPARSRRRGRGRRVRRRAADRRRGGRDRHPRRARIARARPASAARPGRRRDPRAAGRGGRVVDPDRPGPRRRRPSPRRHRPRSGGDRWPPAPARAGALRRSRHAGPRGRTGGRAARGPGPARRARAEPAPTRSDRPPRRRTRATKASGPRGPARTRSRTGGGRDGASHDPRGCDDRDRPGDRHDLGATVRRTRTIDRSGPRSTRSPTGRASSGLSAPRRAPSLPSAVRSPSTATS